MASWKDKHSKNFDKKFLRYLDSLLHYFSNFRALCLEHYLRKHIHDIHKGLKKKRREMPRDCPQCDKKLSTYNL